jgi:hypothetical protein
MQKSKKKGASSTVVVVNTQAKKQSSQKKSKRRKGPTFDIGRDGYLATLADPFGVHGMRIPDDIVTPSATATLRTRLSVIPVQDGSTGNYVAGVNFFATQQNAFQLVTGYNSSTGGLTFGSTTDMSQASTATSLQRSFRTVSAGLAVYNTSKMAANQGRNLCQFIPGSDHATVTSPTSIPTMLLGENLDDMPLNKQSVCSVVYVPTDKSNSAYHTPSGNAATTPFTANYYWPASLSWVATGIDSSSSFEVVIVLNIEFLPNSGSLSFFNVLPSRYNVQAMQRALNSKLSAQMFHTVNPETVYSNEANNNLGLSSAAGGLLSEFGGGVGNFFLPYARNIGYAIASIGTNRLANYAMGNSGYPTRRALLGNDGI